MFNSVDHRNAVQEAVEMGGDPKQLSKHDRTVKMLIEAERKLGSAPDPLPTRELFKILGTSKSFLRLLLKDKQRTADGSYSKTDVRSALRSKLYELSPSRRPRKKKEPSEPSLKEQIAAFTPEQREQFDVVLEQIEAEEKMADEKAANPKWPHPPDCHCVLHG